MIKRHLNLTDPIHVKTKGNTALVTFDFTEHLTGKDLEGVDLKNLKKMLFGFLSGLSGQMYWEDIMQQIVPEDCKQSLACTQLSESFVELLKNSIDAAVSRRRQDHQAPACAMIKITVDSSNPNELMIAIEDSSGGMGVDKLQRMQRMIENETALIETIGSEKSQAESLGGNGRGLRILIAGLAHLSSLDGRKLERAYDRPDEHSRQPQITIEDTYSENTYEKGLKITLRAPQKALKRVRPDTERAASTSPTLFLKPLDKKLRKRERRANSDASALTKPKAQGPSR